MPLEDMLMPPSRFQTLANNRSDGSSCSATDAAGAVGGQLDSVFKTPTV